ncbi:sensor histidine kinase [Desulfovibrio inopinatus]|uniref:sensor histidine kinase n=1 Tax=Desulfovibrio inopinatus TaxID=102109 RepID=UPI0004872C96|nr:PAS domain-containing sensor histidine kinase [Desulfovibrio inopinatus]
MKLSEDVKNFIKPRFWALETQEGAWDNQLFNYRRIWLGSVLLLLAVSLVPLTAMFVTDYQLSSKTMENEHTQRILRLVSNTKRTLAYFLGERLSALKFTLEEESFESLTAPKRLEIVLRNLKAGFGGFLDLGVIEESGLQVAYCGSFDLQGRQYSNQDWFKNTLAQGEYVSDVFLGHRKIPHMIVAVRSRRPDGTPFVLRATVDIEHFYDVLEHLELTPKSQTLLLNHDGVLQMPSSTYGNVLDPAPLEVPPYAEHTALYETHEEGGVSLIVGYAYIANTPFILMIVENKAQIMKGWHLLRRQLLWFYIGSIIVILIVVLGMSTYMVNKVFEADQSRERALHHVEYTNRLASIGRLSAGVAHEINNPLAIINEKAGLLKDLFEIKKEYQDDERLLGIVDSILTSVARCGAITKQLLGFARHFEVDVRAVNISEVIEDVLSFLRKEALYRNITLEVDIPADVPQIISDRGKLQQIFVNLVNNAFQAVEKNGTVTIRAQAAEDNGVIARVSDTGCGISRENLEKIFDPFFSTKKSVGGTGLGLSITYGLVRKLRGRITVESELGQGTTFTITLPPILKGVRNENPTC